MKNIFKILIGVSILLLILGSVYAADLSDVQLPTDFKSKSDVFAVNGEFELTSMEYVEQPRLEEGEDSQSFVFITQSFIECFLGNPRGSTG